jgi:hypothetical protein
LSTERSSRVVLLIEDNPGDADLVQAMLEDVDGDRHCFRVRHAGRMSDAIDLVDIHVSALGLVSEDGNSIKARTLALEGRLVALEMMGLLVDYYRVRVGASIR